jgi:hypothetical protein
MMMMMTSMLVISAPSVIGQGHRALVGPIYVVGVAWWSFQPSSQPSSSFCSLDSKGGRLCFKQAPSCVPFLIVRKSDLLEHLLEQGA